MKTNREIDTLIAEKVMGWKWSERAFGNITIYEWQTPVGNMKQDSWKPSTNIKAAWEVVEKMNSSTQAGTVVLKQLYDGMFYCEFQGNGDLQYHGKGHGDTAAEAICRAALNAKGVI